jgi:hypothetical protein
MSPPTIPGPESPAAVEVARTIIAALKSRGYDAGLTDRNNIINHAHFDVTIHWANISIGSKVRNRSWLQVTWDKSVLTFLIYGRRWEGVPFPNEILTIDLAHPDSFNKIVDFIVEISTEDKYRYPFI